MDATGTRTTSPPPVTGVETRSIDYVPVSERHGKVWHLGPLWFAGNAQLATVAIGAGRRGQRAQLQLVPGGHHPRRADRHAVHGVPLGAGTEAGLPQMIQSRPQFGYYGALLPVVVAVLLFIGFNVFNTRSRRRRSSETLNVQHDRRRDHHRDPRRSPSPSSATD